MSASTKTLYLILRITRKCNISCKYCYAADDVGSTSEMSEEEFSRTVEWIATYAKYAGYNKLKLLLHGGEVFTVSIDKLKTCLDSGKDICSAIGLDLEYLIQTNLIGLSSEHIKLIKDYFFRPVGTSLDYMSDFRCFKNGKDTFSKVLDNIHYLRKNGIKVGVITQITPKNYDKVEEIYSFFKNENLPIKISRIFPSSQRDLSSCIVSDEQYTTALMKLFDIWYNDPHPLYISNFREYLRLFLTGKAQCCVHCGNCQPHNISVAPGGNIYPCGEFYSETDTIGNIYLSTPENVWDEKRAVLFSNRAAISDKCKNCRYYVYCNGGCMAERLTFGCAQSCVTIQTLFKHIEDILTSSNIKIYEIAKK